MKELIDEIDYALEIANYEAEAGNMVMVLVPNRGWLSAALRLREWKGVYLRASTVESSLKSVAIDTLVLVGRDHPDWNEKGERYARERLRTSLKPRVILAEEDR